MTPAVRRLLREHGLEAAQIVGTGGGGRLTRDDVLDFVEAPANGQAGRRPGRPRPQPHPRHLPAAARPGSHRVPRPPPLRRSRSRPVPTKCSSR